MADAYAREITNQAVARACVALGKIATHLLPTSRQLKTVIMTAGYKETQITTLDCLADLVRHYIQSISANLLESSETSGRVHPGIQDLMSVLGDSVCFLARKLSVMHHILSFLFKI